MSTAGGDLSGSLFTPDARSAEYGDVQYFITFQPDGVSIPISGFSFGIGETDAGAAFQKLEFSQEFRPVASMFLLKKVLAGQSDDGTFSSAVVQAFVMQDGERKLAEEHALANAAIASVVITDDRMADVTLDFGAVRSRYFEPDADGIMQPAGSNTWSEVTDTPTLTGGRGLQNPPSPTFDEVTHLSEAPLVATQAFVRVDGGDWIPVKSRSLGAANALEIGDNPHSGISDPELGVSWADLGSLDLTLDPNALNAQQLYRKAANGNSAQLDLLVATPDGSTFRPLALYQFERTFVFGADVARSAADGVGDDLHIIFTDVTATYGIPGANIDYDFITGRLISGPSTLPHPFDESIEQTEIRPVADYGSARYFVTLRPAGQPNKAFTIEVDGFSLGIERAFDEQTKPGADVTPGAAVLTPLTLSFAAGAALPPLLQALALETRFSDAIIRVFDGDPAGGTLLEEHDIGDVRVRSLDVAGADGADTATLGVAMDYTRFQSTFWESDEHGDRVVGGTASWDSIQKEPRYDAAKLDLPMAAILDPRLGTFDAFGYVDAGPDGEDIVADPSVPAGPGTGFDILNYDFGATNDRPSDNADDVTTLGTFHFTMPASAAGHGFSRTLLQGEACEHLFVVLADADGAKHRYDLAHAFVQELKIVYQNGEAVLDVTLDYRALQVASFEPGSDEPDAIATWDQVAQAPTLPAGTGELSGADGEAAGADAAGAGSQTFVATFRDGASAYSVALDTLALGFHNEADIAAASGAPDDSPPVLLEATFSIALTAELEALFASADARTALDALTLQLFVPDGGDMKAVQSHHLDGARIIGIDVEGGKANITVSYTAIASRWYELEAGGDPELAGTTRWDSGEARAVYRGAIDNPTWDEVQARLAEAPPQLEYFIRFRGGDAPDPGGWLALSDCGFGIERSGGGAERSLRIAFAPDGQAAALMNALVEDEHFAEADLVLASRDPSGDLRVYDHVRFSTVTVEGADELGGVASVELAFATADFSPGSAEPANSAPVLDAGKSPALDPIDEDTGAPGVGAGTLVSRLVDFAGNGGNDNVSDADGAAALTGIALTGVDSSHGTWLYSTNNGSAWTAIGDLSDSSALLLSANQKTRLYFRPDADFSGTVSEAITFRAWDRTAGSNGATVDVSASGGSSAFSGASDTASITVNPLSQADVTAITRADPTPTSAATVRYNVTFSEAVTGVDASDFALVTSDPLDGASIVHVDGAGDSYVVTIDTGNFNGTFRLDLVDDDTILDGGSSPLGGAGLGNGNASGETYHVDRVVPMVTGIVRADPSPTSAPSIQYTVTFSKNVTGVDESDFALTTGGVSGAGIVDVSGSGATWTVTVDTGTGDGTLRLDLADDDSIVDSASNRLGDAGEGNGDFTGGQVYTIDHAPPSVTINQGAGQDDPIHGGAVVFDVVFSEAVSGFTGDDISFLGSTAPGALAAEVSGSGTTYTVSVTGMTGTGAIVASILAGAALDALGNPSLASASADNTVTFVLPQSGTPGDDGFTAPDGLARFDALGGLDTITFGFALTDATIRYDGNMVVIDSATSHTALTGFERFVFTDGTVENADGNPLIDDLFYYSRNHDVWTAHADADLHYSAAGWKEGRDPNAFFDTSLYLAANPDVGAAGVDPLSHFDQIGWTEGRLPSLAFDPAAYLAANPDVAAARIDPLLHFLQWGAAEGRQPSAPARLVASDGFDFVHYLQQNPDIEAAGVDPHQHFLTIGWQEGRNPNAWFDTAGYLAEYADVAAAHVNPLLHYNDSGWHEGRDPSVDFDTAGYLAANPDVAAANVNPLLHFLQYGIAEGRPPEGDGLWG